MDSFIATFLKIFIKGFLSLWYLWVILLAVIIGKYVTRLLELNRLAKSGIDDIDKMDGKTFEKYLEALFLKLGYQVERTRYVGDYGADLVTVKNGVKTIIQAKRYKKKVGVKAVQEAVAAKGYYQCDKAMVVTNNHYTRQATELARANSVELWDRDQLVQALLSVRNGINNNAMREACVSAEPVEAVKPDVAAANDNICVVCGQVVSDKVRQYCLDHAERSGGRIYCFEHQKGLRNEGPCGK